MDPAPRPPRRSAVPALVLVAVLATAGLGLVGCGDDEDGGDGGDTTTTAEVASGPLDGGSWRLVEGSLAESSGTAAPVTMQFVAGAVSGNSGCNTYNASYEVSEGARLSFGPVALTKMACEPEAEAAEAAFVDALERVEGFTVDGDRMTMTDADGNALMSFDPA